MDERDTRQKPEEEQPDIFYGIKLSDVTDEILKGVLDIYFGIAEIAPASWKKASKADLVERLKGTNGADYRFGSKYSMNSKLWIWVSEYLCDEKGNGVDRVVKFSFDPNTNVGSKAQKLELQAKQEEFKRAASMYVQNSGFGFTLEQK